MEFMYDAHTYLIVFWFFMGMLVGSVLSRLFHPVLPQNTPLSSPLYTSERAPRITSSTLGASTLQKRDKSMPQKKDDEIRG